MRLLGNGRATMPSAHSRSGWEGSYWSGVKIDIVAVDCCITREGEVYVVVDLTSSLSLRFNSFFTWLTDVQGKMRCLANPVTKIAPQGFFPPLLAFLASSSLITLWKQIRMLTSSSGVNFFRVKALPYRGTFQFMIIDLWWAGDCFVCILNL